MSSRTVITEPIPELTTPTFTFQIVGGDDVGFEPTTLVLSNYNNRDGSFLNSRNRQDVKDTNQVTIDADGNVEWQALAADLALVQSTQAVETHIALFEWSWSSGTKVGKHEIEYRVTNLQKVP